MRIFRWLVVVSLVLCAASVAPAAHAQYVGGQPPPVGPVDQGIPTLVQGEQFTQQAPATPVVPITKQKSDNGLFGGLTLGDLITGAAVIGALGLLWFFLLWRRRREDEEEEGLVATG